MANMTSTIEETCQLERNGLVRRCFQAFWLQMTLLGVVLAITIITATGMGYLELPMAAVLRIVAAKALALPALLDRLDPMWPVVVMDVRLPRILTAVLVGGGLGISGVIFQGILLNPLADPYTLGVSAGAAFGASVALLFNFSLIGMGTVPLCAFIGAALTLAAVIYLASGNGGLASNNLILAGIIVAAILAAGVSFIKYLADEQVAIIIFWLMGSLTSKTWAHVILMTSAVGLGMAVFTYFGRDLNLMAMGNRTAGSLGLDIRKVPLILLITASMVTAICVAVAGIIGFVGLLVPHMMRGLTGPDNRRLIPASALAGAILLLCADTVTRAILPREIPIGVITALIGGPFFCFIYRQRLRNED